MKRAAALLLCLLLVLGTGCGSQAAPMRNVTTLQLAAQRGLSNEARAGLSLFIHKVQELSQGELVIEVVASDDVLESLDQGCALILASNTEIARANANFNAFSSPFYFYDYSHLSLTLNSQRFTDIIGDGMLSLMGALPIAAFYDGNSVLLSSSELSFDTVDQFDGASITIANDPIFSELLRGFGAKVRIREEESQRLDTFCRGGEQVVECKITSLTVLTELPEGQAFTVGQTFHRAQINWMMLSQNAKQTLSTRDLAVLTEAAAFAISENDRLVLEAEQAAYDTVQELGGDLVPIIYGEFFAPTAQVLRASSRYGALWDWEQYAEVQEIATKNAG